MKTYYITAKSDKDFESALKLVRENIKREGFGILCEIDVAAKMKEKLGKDMPPYLILGACHPESAYQAIQAEPDIGVMLPCNIIVRDSSDGVIVSAIRPSVAMGMIDNPQLKFMAEEIEQKLEKIVKADDKL